MSKTQGKAIQKAMHQKSRTEASVMKVQLNNNTNLVLEFCGSLSSVRIKKYPLLVHC